MLKLAKVYIVKSLKIDLGEEGFYLLKKKLCFVQD